MKRSTILPAVLALLVAAACGDTEPAGGETAPVPAAVTASVVDGASATPGDTPVAASVGDGETLSGDAPAAEPVLRTVELGEGLVVEVLREGQGRKARSSSTVLARYEGRVRDADTAFVSTRTYPQPERLELDPVKGARPMEGLARALEGLAAGTRARVRVPAALGYGKRGVPELGIAPDSDLVFEVEVVEVR
jgi:FKBP-type peptidyl-prolyl cis-trans isomerase